MNIVSTLKQITADAIQNLYKSDTDVSAITISATKSDFEGDYTVVLFSLLKQLKKSADAAGNEIGNYLLHHNPQIIGSFNVIKGFLNLVIADSFWLSFLHQNYNNTEFGKAEKKHSRVMVEYSSPNANKPIHLGHLRNDFLGWSIAAILDYNGYDTVKTSIINDRGVHICKSMLAWKLFANGATPEETNIKGDRFVGDYYVKFNEEYKKQVEQLMHAGIKKEEAEMQAPIMKAAQQMLVDWEAGKPEIRALWQKMNNWVYKGFAETYHRIGVDFDKTYYESETYLLGKELVKEGLEKGIFYKKEDESVWINLTAEGLDEKILQRKDGTAVYITQDIGLIIKKYNEYNSNQSIYVVGDEQKYHFTVLKLIAQKLSLPSAENIYHLSYGMVELPTGKMKSREGTVVDADDLLDEMLVIAKEKTEELGKVKDFSETELTALYETLGTGALKFYLLRVDPKKKMMFNPEESIDLHGFTAPFIQYTYARIKSILRKESVSNYFAYAAGSLLSLEKGVIKHLEQFPVALEEAASEYDPSKIAIHAFITAKLFNAFYTQHSVLQAETEEKKILRLQLAAFTAQTLKTVMHLLGINMPERM